MPKTRAQKFMEILLRRENDLVEFLGMTHVKLRKDKWFYEKTLRENRRMQKLLRVLYL